MKLLATNVIKKLDEFIHETEFEPLKILTPVH